MHPGVRQLGPGSCPVCGMSLEPLALSSGTESNTELMNMRRRFWASAALAVPLMVNSMAEMFGYELLKASVASGIQLALATPVVMWGGWPFLARAWRSVRTRQRNMFTLIGLGVLVAYLYSLVGVFAPDVFPATFRDAKGQVGLYFEASAMIITLVLLGQWLELRARN